MKPTLRVPIVFAALALLVACATHAVVSEGAHCTDDAQCTRGKQSCNVQQGTCAAILPGVELGSGDGSAASVALFEVMSAPGSELVDLAFNADDPTQLWVVDYVHDRVHVGTGVGSSGVKWQAMHDPAAIHFMHLPPAMAWGSNGFWGTCGDNDNAQNDPRGANEANFFMGPSLFTSDLNIFAKDNPGDAGLGLGSHYDMLHNTSFCRGIAHEEDNVFWTFNGELGSLDKYNFNKPHIPGGDDHSDGEIYRYALGQVKGVDKTSSDLAYDPDDKFLYVADTGNKRIVKLDTTKGTLGDPLPRQNEPLKKNGVMNGTQVDVVVPPGVLDTPSGLEVWNSLVYVTDTATGRFYAFDKSGKEIRHLETGLPAGSLAGFTFGPDNKIWFVDRKAGKVLRIDPPR
jgi:hypothetical protein